MTDYLHNRGTDKLLAAIAATPDPKPAPKFTAADTAHDAETPLRERAVRDIMAAPEASREQLISYAMIDAFSRGRMSGIDEGVSIGKRHRPSVMKVELTDLGDGLCLPLVSIGPSGVNGYAQSQSCGTCGLAALPGSDECISCKQARHSDDDAQRAAQEREDAEVDSGE